MNYENYIAVDWAQNNMAVARMTKSSEQVKVFEGPSSVKDLRVYLKGLSGSKILSIEESHSFPVALYRTQRKCEQAHHLRSFKESPFTRGV